MIDENNILNIDFRILEDHEIICSGDYCRYKNAYNWDLINNSTFLGISVKAAKLLCSSFHFARKNDFHFFKEPFNLL